eukprot:m.171555 g.171555  ORF g.171555 m.171555 type:complete len:100 (+) comp39058_c0_seq10:621-920(+)
MIVTHCPGNSLYRGVRISIHRSLCSPLIEMSQYLDKPSDTTKIHSLTCNDDFTLSSKEKEAWTTEVSQENSLTYYTQQSRKTKTLPKEDLIEAIKRYVP